MQQSKLDCSWQKKKTNCWAPVLTVSMACQTKYITLYCTVNLQPFMKLQSTAMYKGTGCLETGFRRDWVILDYSISSKSIKIDHDDWANVCAKTPAVNLTIFSLFLKLKWQDQRWNEQLCTVATHSVLCCLTNLFCQQIRNGGKQHPNPIRWIKDIQRQSDSLTYIVKSRAWISDGCLLETPALSLLREGAGREVHYLFSLT